MNSRFYLILLLLALWIILGLYLCNKYICGTTDNVVAAAPAVIPEKDICEISWSLNDGTTFSSGDITSNFRFGRSDFQLANISNDVQSAVQSISTYLSNNDGRALNITGYYDSLETNGSILANLGSARANSIKKLFTDSGIAANRLQTSSEEASELCYSNDTLNRGALLSFVDVGASDTRIADIKNRLFGKPITLYFGTNQKNIDLSSSQRRDFTDLIYYLDNVATAKLEVNGHTDADGSRSYNVNLSQKRADFVKDYLFRRGGIGINRMPTSGFGPDQPIASNNTSSGKAKNRRVEVILR